MKLLFKIALGFLLARKNQTIVAAVGVTFSITMFISLLGFMGGLNSLLDGLILNSTPHITLYKELKPSENQPLNFSKDYLGYHHFIKNIKPKNENLDIYKSLEIVKVLEKQKYVKGVSSKVTSQAFFSVGQVEYTGVINGIDVVKENDLFGFGERVVEGDLENLQNSENSIIIGVGLAEVMLLEVGDLIQVKTSNGQKRLTIVGLYSSGIADVDKTQCFANVSTVQKLIGASSSSLTQIQVKLFDLSLAPQLAKIYAQVFNTETTDIQTANAQFDTGSSIRTLISYVVGITLLIVAGFGIYNILNMMIYDKMDSIAILKATGFSGEDVGKVFIMVALAIGIVGGMLGLFFGYLSSVLIGLIPFENSSFPSVTTYPIETNSSYYVIAIIFSVVTTYFAGYFPSRKAKKVDPVVIIRGK